MFIPVLAIVTGLLVICATAYFVREMQEAKAFNEVFLQFAEQDTRGGLVQRQEMLRRVAEAHIGTRAMEAEKIARLQRALQAREVSDAWIRALKDEVRMLRMQQPKESRTTFDQHVPSGALADMLSFNVNETTRPGFLQGPAPEPTVTAVED